MIHSDVKFSDLPFNAWHSAPQVMSGAHVHTDIELNFFLSGQATYFHAGRFYEIPPRRLAVFWGGMPHRLTAIAPSTEYYCITLPLAWFLEWNLAGPLPSRLLAGELILETDEEAAALDKPTIARWTSDLRTGGAEGRRIALLEVEARLRRLALIIGSAALRAADPKSPVRGHQMERIAEYIGNHYRKALTVAEIAAAVGLHSNYAATAFRKGSGLSLWEYVTRLRISHAQRLLLTTDWTVERIALDCGFASPARFFAAFKRLCGVTPRQYRRR